MKEPVKDVEEPPQKQVSVRSRGRRPWIGAVIVICAIVGATFTLTKVVGQSGSRSAEAKMIVEEYLLALRGNDADVARRYLADPNNLQEGVDPWPALSREVLTASNEIAPIDRIEVREPHVVASGFYEVPTSFYIGDERVERSFHVSTKGGLRINDGLVTVGSPHLTASGLRVNGETVPYRKLDLFPGGYVFDAKFDAFEFPGAGEPVIIVDQGDTNAFEEMTRPQLTTEAEAFFRAQVRESFESCIASQLFSPGCGLEVSGTVPGEHDGVVVDSTQRTLTPEAEEKILSAIDNLELVESPSHLGKFSAELPTLDTIDDIMVTVEATKGDTRTRMNVPQVSDLKIPSIDFGDFIPRVSWH